MTNLEKTIIENKRLLISNIKNLALQLVTYEQSDKYRDKSSSNNCIKMNLDNGISVHIHFDSSKEYVKERMENEDIFWAQSREILDSVSKEEINKDSSIATSDDDPELPIDRHIHPGDIAIKKSFS